MLADGILTLEKITEYARLLLDEIKKLKAERTKCRTVLEFVIKK